MPDPHRIDVHHHFLPPQYLEAGRREGTSFGGGALIPDWDLARALEVMDRNGIATAIASVPAFDNAGRGFSTRWARHCNEFMARARADQPARFGGFACLPLPDTAGACAELEYALDTLDLDGALLMSSAEGRYPGDAGFEELFAELARRRAVVFIHPTIAPPGSKVPQLDLPEFMAEFVFDTTRCVANLLYSGTLERHPEIRFIVAHAGGTVPFLAGRLALGQGLPKLRDAVPKGPLHYLKQLHFDTALSANPYALASLCALVPPSQILFGSDFPMAAEPIAKASISGLAAYDGLDAAGLRAVERDSALPLFPRLAAE